jgi:hypothetical protein
MAVEATVTQRNVPRGAASERERFAIARRQTRQTLELMWRAAAFLRASSWLAAAIQSAGAAAGDPGKMSGMPLVWLRQFRTVISLQAFGSSGKSCVTLSPRRSFPSCTSK